MRIKQVQEGYGTSYNDLKSGTSKPADFDKVLDKAKEPVKATDKKGSQVDVISTAGEKDVVVQHKNKKKEIVKSKDLTLEAKLKRATKIKNKYRKLTNKLARKYLKEQPSELYEINFRRKEIGKEALDAPIKCGFEAESYFFDVEPNSSGDVDEMSISDVEYEYGDLPDQAYEDYQTWLYDKGQSEYLDDLVGDKIEEVREDEDWLNDFIDSSDGPSSEAVERYKKDFEEADPQEYENREEDGWDYMNWVREFVEEEYEDEYGAWLDDAVREEYDLDEEAREAAEREYSMEDWIYDQYSYMSSFLDDYGYDYGSATGSTEGVANEFNRWVQANSKFDDFPEYGEYGDTYTTTGWAVETDSSIDADSGAPAELISPVFDSPRQMLEELKSLFEWSEDQFGTNSSTGFHVTMSWQGEPDAPRSDDGRMQGQEPNKLKMALLLGDQYLLAQFNRLKNTYTKSQYDMVLKHAEGMKKGNAKSFKDFEKELSKGISRDKFSSIHFKGEKDDNSGNQLIEFRIAGGKDYNEQFTKIFNAVIRYATVMKAGYDEDAFRKDYVQAVGRLLRKATEIDPEKAKRYETVTHEIIDSAKGIVGKKDYFEVMRLLSSAVEYKQEYEELSKPEADKKWKQSIKDYEKGTGDKVEIEEVEEKEPIQGYIKPSTIPPSKEAEARLKQGQERFASAVSILARDISDKNNRGPVSAKSIRIFRNFQNELKLKDSDLERITMQRLRDDRGSSSKNVTKLVNGMNALFKKDIATMPDFLKIQDFEPIADGLWHFLQSPDVNDNQVVEKFVDLFAKISNFEDRKDDVRTTIKQLSKKRQKNEVFRYLKDGGYGVELTLLSPDTITDKKALEQLKKELSKYEGYKHPTSRDHHVNVRSDDKYAEVFSMNLTQKLRDRINYLKDIKETEPQKYEKITKQLLDIGEETVKKMYEPNTKEYDSPKQMVKQGDIKEYNGWGQIENEDEWEQEYLAVTKRAYTRVQDFIDQIRKDPDTFNFGPGYDDYVLHNTVGMLPIYFKNIEKPIPGKAIESFPPVRKFITANFKAIKKLLTTIDKIFQAEGFVDLGKEIKGKNTLNRQNKDFEKNVRSKAKTNFNIPSHSWVYIDKNFYDTITDDSYNDRAAYLENHLEEFNDSRNQQGSKVYVVAAAHYMEAEDAYNGLDLIEKFEGASNYFHSWRKNDYNRILSKFAAKYGVKFETLTSSKDFYHAGGNEYQKLKELGIEVTDKGDSRAGMPGIKDLLDREKAVNPVSGEPLNRDSAVVWSVNNDDSDQKRFDALDWSMYPPEMKDYVKAEMKKTEDFKSALENTLQKIVDGELDIHLDKTNNEKGMATAAGVEDYVSASSNEVAGATNWSNLSDYLGIERGVNDQGPNLLKKVYDMFDSNHNWRPEEDPDAIGIQRWAAAVKASKEYIDKNYTVSGGNYFRDGDNVSQMYGGSEPTADSSEKPDYDRAREAHPGFNTMMRNGIQNYLVRGEVNDLVGFLNNPDNDNVFKSAVLNTLANRFENNPGYPADSFRDVLAVTRRHGYESVFDRFDKLPLQEQLLIVSKSKVLEGTRCWKGYKKKGMKTMFGKRVPNCVKNESEVVPINKAAPGEYRVGYPPYFSDAEAERAADEYNNQAQIDQDDGVLVTSEDGKNYRIFRKEDQHSDPQHFEPGEVYLVNDYETNPKEYVDTEGYPDVEELLYHHSKQGYYVGMDESEDGDEGNWEYFMQQLKASGWPQNPIPNADVDGKLVDLLNDPKAGKEHKELIRKYFNWGGGFDIAIPGDVIDQEQLGKVTVLKIIGKDMYNMPAEYLVKTQEGSQLPITFDELVLGNEYGSETDIGGSKLMNSVEENFADGKKKGKSRPGRVKRAGASCKGSVTSLRKKAKNSSGEKAKMYHWCANMKSGKKKANEDLQTKLKLMVKANAISESLMMTEVDRVKDINDILSAEFPVNNYKLQMKAFVALPVPEMLDAFKDLHAKYGAKADAREIVRHFAKSRMPKQQLTKINLGV